MKKKRILKSIAITLLWTICMVGCSQSEDITTKETTKSLETDSVNDNVENMKKVSASEICSNISINGKKVEFPWTLKSLGEEYELGEENDENQVAGSGSCYLKYKGQDYVKVSYKKRGSESLREIYLVEFKPTDNIYLFDLNENSTIDDVIKLLGEPDKKGNGAVEGLDGYIYDIDGMRITIMFRDGKIILTTISTGMN